MARPCPGATRLIAIDGLGGAGKSTLARHVAGLVGGSVVHLDELGTWPEGPDIARLRREVVAPLQAGHTARYQAWDWTAMRQGAWRSIAAGGVVVIEGSGSTSLEVAEQLTFTVWVDCQQDIRLERTLARDGPQVLGAWKHWSAWEDQYLAAHQPRRRADLIVTNDSPVTRGWEQESATSSAATVSHASAGVVDAAGGLVWRRTAGGVEVILVHRPLRDDWTLPIGRVEPGETLEACALREVAEETGRQCRLVDFIGVLEVDADDGLHRFHIYEMEALGGAFAANAETDLAPWLPIQDAISRTTYPNVRSLLVAASHRL